MSENKIWDLLLKVFYSDREIRKEIYRRIPMDHPMRKHWGQIMRSDHSHDGQQDEIVLLLNEVLQSSEDSNE